MSFDNLSGVKKEKFNLVLFILLTFMALLVAMLIPGVGLIGAALLPVPVSLLIISGRVRDGVICAAAACLVLFLFNYVLASVAIIFIISIAFSQRHAIEEKQPAGKTVLMILFIFLGGACLLALLYLLIYGPVFFTGMADTYNGYIEEIYNDPLISEYARIMAIDSTQLNAAISQTQAMLRFMPGILPGLLIVSFSIISLANYLFSTMIFKRYQIKIKPFIPFIKWDLSWYFVWGIIVGIVLVLIPETGGAIDIATDMIGYNLIIIFGTIYAVLGGAVLWGLFKRFKTGLMMKVIIGIFLLFFFGFALIIFPALGLIDIWANFRRLKRN